MSALTLSLRYRAKKMIRLFVKLRFVQRGYCDKTITSQTIVSDQVPALPAIKRCSAENVNKRNYSYVLFL